jgi:F-type H+-transporting ATPase subunit delta
LNEVKGRVEARIVGASPLEPAQVEEVRDALRAISRKEVVLHEETDPALIGGLLVELEGKIYDGTVRTQLENMKERIARGY